MEIHIDQSNNVHIISVKCRREVGPSKSGGAVSFSPMLLLSSPSSLSDDFIIVIVTGWLLMFTLAIILMGEW